MSKIIDIFDIMKGFIYSLSCPVTGQIRYIGRTIDLKHRLIGHICLAKNDNNPNKELTEWIKSLLQINETPIMTKLDEAENGRWLSDLEQFYIDKYCDTGLLLNRGRLTKKHNEINYKSLRLLAKAKRIRYKVIAAHLGVDYCSVAGYLTGQRCQLGIEKARRLESFINAY